MSARAPSSLWLLRHGQSAGNLQAEAAERGGLELIDIAERDMDVDLSPLGQEQARAFGRWLGRLPEGEQPQAVLSSPYVRARRTAEIALEEAGLSDLEVVLDERLRERELGILDLHTIRGIRARYPGEAERRERLGKMYYRPPGGESWADVALRVRSVRDSITLEHEGRRVLVVAHEVVVLIARYLIEAMSEADLLSLNRTDSVANCALTRYDRDGDGRLELVAYNEVGHLDEVSAEVTEEPDARVGVR